MINKTDILNITGDLLREKNLFIVSLDISHSNSIRLVVDSMEGVTVDSCVLLSRAIENNLDREKEDFDIEVTSPGLGSPFRIMEQYVKNIGREIEVITKDGRTEKGILAEAGDDTFSIEQEKRIKTEGSKKKQTVINRLSFAYSDTSKVRNIIKL